MDESSNLALTITRGQGALVQALAGSSAPGEYEFAFNSEAFARRARLVLATVYSHDLGGQGGRARDRRGRCFLI